MKSTLNLRERVVGIGHPVPLLDGSLATYVNLDNAASTPALKDVTEAIDRFLPYYASIHRGTGFKSRLSTAAYDQAHRIIGRFVGADLTTHTVIFGKNTTEAINKLSYRLPLPPQLRHPHNPTGAPLQRPALAAAGAGCARQRHARRPAGRRRFRPEA